MTVFESPALTYKVNGPAIDLEWSDLNVDTFTNPDLEWSDLNVDTFTNPDFEWSDLNVDTFTNPSISCGPMEFLIENQDGSMLESTVFTTILDGSLGASQFL